MLRRQLAYGCGREQALTIHADDVEKHHGRIEKRKYEVFDTQKILKKWPEWAKVKSVIRVTRSRIQVHELRNNKGEPSESVFYYVSNKILPARETGKHIREHWFIENKLHHVRDRSFLEDNMVKRENPFIFAALISFALNMMHVNKIENIRSNLYYNSMTFLNMMESINYL